MSPARAPTSSSSGGGRAAVTALIVVAVAVGMLLLVRSRPKVEAFDPRSSAPSGANAAVLLMEQFGAEVAITSRPPDPGEAERVFVIDDRLDTSQRQALLEFVDGGGVAVVADPDSTLHGGPGVDGGATEVDGTASGASTGGQLDAAVEANVPVGDCTIAALQDLRGVFSPRGVLFPTAPDEGRCFGSRGHSFVVVRHYGRGIVIGFGDNRVVTNQYLRYADNSGLVTALLAPSRGTHVRILLGRGAAPAPQDVGRGDTTLLGLVHPGVWMALAQLGLAFVVFCVARGVRPGRAVRERLPTPIAGSELALATGNLMQRARHAQRAGWLLRAEFHRRLVAHHRASADITIEAISRLAGSRAGVEPERISELLLRDVTDSAGLMQLRHDLDDLQARTIGAVPHPPSDRISEHV